MIWSDTTFNMWEGFVTSVVYKNPNLENKIFVRFVYLHQLLDKKTYIELLAHLSYIMNLKLSEESLRTMITDSDAQMIKVWINTFKNIDQQLCFIHFCKNIKDKMKY